MDPLSPRNPRVQEVRRLARQGRHRADRRAFVVEGPVLVLHGERDGIVPVAHAHAFAAAAARADLRLLPCGHNDCPFQWRRVEEFLEREGLLP